MENELYHHGILGQKWGVRRFQNEDGSVTPAGEKRYYEGDSNSKTSSSKKGRATGTASHDVQKTGEKISTNKVGDNGFRNSNRPSSYKGNDYYKTNGVDKSDNSLGAKYYKNAGTHQRSSDYYNALYSAAKSKYGSGISNINNRNQTFNVNGKSINRIDLNAKLNGFEGDYSGNSYNMAYLNVADDGTITVESGNALQRMALKELTEFLEANSEISKSKNKVDNIKKRANAVIQGAQSIAMSKIAEINLNTGIFDKANDLLEKMGF